MVFNYSLSMGRFISASDIKKRYENNPLLFTEGSSISNNQSRVCSVREHDSILYYRSSFKDSSMYLRIKLRHDDVYTTFSFSKLPQSEISYAYGHCLTILNNFFPEAVEIKDEDSELNIENMIDFVKTFGFIPIKKMFGIGKIQEEDSPSTIIHTTGLRRLGGSDLLMVIDKEDLDLAINVINSIGVSVATGDWKDIHSTTHEAAKALSGDTIEVSLVSLDALTRLKDYNLAKEILGEYINCESFYVPVLVSKKQNLLEQGRYPREYIKKIQKYKMFIRISSQEREEYEISSKKFMPLAIETLERGESVKIFFYDGKSEPGGHMFFSFAANVFDYKDGYFFGTDLDGKNRCINEKDVYYWKTESFSPLSIPSTVRICAALTN